MAKAKYYNGSSYVDWNASMVNGFDLNGHNRSINLTHNGQNETGYRCVLNHTITSTWQECRASYAIASRHSGTGVISFGYYSGSNTNVGGVNLEFHGTISNMYSDAWTAVVNGNNIKLYCRMQDYNNVYLACLENYGMPAWSNGAWATSLPSGTKYQVNINSKQIYVQSSQPTQSDAVLWVQV